MITLIVLLQYFQMHIYVSILCTFQNFSGEDTFCQRSPLLVVQVQGWPELNERQIYQEFKALCRFDVRQLSKNQFILLADKFKQ